MFGITAIKKSMKEHSAIFSLVAVVLFFQILLAATGNGTQINPVNIASLIRQNAYIVILAIGMMICILTGGNIDLSVGSAMGMLSAMISILMGQLDLNTPVSLLLILLCGVALGAWNGFWIAVMRVPSFLVTLTGMFMWRGLSLILLRGANISQVPEHKVAFLSSYIAPAGASAMAVCLVAGVLFCVVYITVCLMERVQRRRLGSAFFMESNLSFIFRLAVISLVTLWLCYTLGRTQGFSFVFLLMVAVVLVYSFYTQRTVPGRHIYAMGGNERAAKFSGINTRRILFAAYANMGLLTAVAAIISIGRFNSASSADEPLINTFGACFVGGVSAYGGVGTVSGVVAGAVFMMLFNNGMSIMGVPTNWQRVIQGLVLLFVLAMDIVLKKRSGRQN